MRVMRKIMKAAHLLLICLCFLIIGAAVSLICFAVPSRRSLLRARCQRLWALLVSATLGIRTERAGGGWHGSGQGGRFIVANHISYLDIVVLAGALPIAFLSKHDVRSWPVLGWLATMAGTIYVDRSSPRDAVSAMGEIRERLGHGVSVVVFPEGTTSDGMQVMEFKSAFFDLPLRACVPVVPIAVQYLAADGKEDPAEATAAIAWFGDAPLLPNVWRVLGMRAIRVRLVSGAVLVPGSSEITDRKALARAARDSVARSYCNPRE